MSRPVDDRTATPGDPSGTPPQPPDFVDLVGLVAGTLACDPSGLTPDVKVSELCADSLDLYCLYIALDEWVPGFVLPRQLELEVATLADVHHYLVVRLEQRRG